MMNNYDKLTLSMAFCLSAPATWTASLLPSIFAALYCWKNSCPLSFPKSVLLVSTCVLMQSSVNTLNDYIDFIKKTDTLSDNLEKNDAVLLYNNVNPVHVLYLGIFYLGIGGILGLIGSLPAYKAVLIGIAGALAVVNYSIGKTPISYLPIGEIVSGFVMGGLIPLAVSAVPDNSFHFEILIKSLPFILGIGLIMLSNNTSDIEKDSLAHRNTFAAIIGREKAKKIYKVFLIIWIAAIIFFSYGLLREKCIVSIIMMLILRKPFTVLLKSDLKPEDRINTMKNIGKANLFGNGTYIVSLLIAILIER